jgi:cytoskeleton protein RodZ
VIAAESGVAELPTDPGARLRRQREQSGRSEQEVADGLNLDARVVEALERNDYDTLGAPVFVRGHLKRYASLLGLDEDEVLGAYDRSRSRLGQPTLVPKTREEMPVVRTRVRGRRRWPRFAGLAVLVLSAAGVSGYLFAFGLKLPGGQGSSGAGAAPVPVSGLAGARDRAPVPGEPGSGAGTAAVVPAGQLAVELAFAADSWVEIYDGSGRALLYDLGRAGSRRAVAGTPPLSITLGNAPAVGVVVGGRKYDVPQPPQGTTVVRFELGGAPSH